MALRAIGYIRVSTGEQAEEGHSLFAQRTAIEQFCKAHGLELVGIKVDAGLSGTQGDRPALEDLLEEAKRGGFDVVIVHAIDRFYRDLEGLLKALNHLRQYNVSFISITENLDFSTPWGKLTLAVLGTLAEIYIDRLRQETRKGKRARAAKGLHNGTPPLGYCYGNCAVCQDPNGADYCPRYGGPSIQDYTPALPLAPHPIESVAVQLAFEWYATGDYSDGDIAERLNAYVYTSPNGADDEHPIDVHFRTKGRWGRGSPGRFGKDSVRDLLQHPFYTGVVPYFGVDEAGRKRKRCDAVALYPGQHEPLVDQETFDHCQKVRDLMGHHPRTGADTMERIYVLSGILTCSFCGQPMLGHTGNGIRYYRDKSRIQHLVDCPQVHVHADDVEAQFARLIQDVQLPDDWREAVVAAANPDLDADAIKAREAKLNAQLERAKRLYIDGDIDRAQYEQEKLRCQESLSDLRPVIYHDIISTGEILESSSEWNALTPLQKKERSRMLFTTVLIRGTRLLAAKLTDACYALIQLSVDVRQPHPRGCCNHGSDGACTPSDKIVVLPPDEVPPDWVIK